MKIRRWGLVLLLLLGLSPSVTSGQEAGRRDPAQVMRGLRLSFLSSPPVRPASGNPRVLGVAMDWPLGEHTATLVSALDGSASLYTTATFGIIGGDAHEAVRSAAQRFVKLADAHHDEAVPTRDYAYPGKGKVRFYLRTVGDVRVIEADAASVSSSSGGPHAALFRAGHAVLTELRKVTEQPR
jgi:hypothetical protein